jgi:hypothetical protein
MINSIQSKLLPVGEHTNTSIRKAFGLPSREVNFVDEDGKKSSYTPNRRQRKAVSKAAAQTRNRWVFENSEDGKKKLKERAAKKAEAARLKSVAAEMKRDKFLEKTALSTKKEKTEIKGSFLNSKLFSKSKQKSNY